MTVPTAPLAYFWGDDDLAIGRAVEGLRAHLGEASGAPLERWDLRGDRNQASEQLARLHERVATPVLFGGGSLAVVANAGAMTISNEQRAAFLDALALVAPGNGVAIVEASPSGAKGPGQKRLAEAVAAAGGMVRQFASPKAGALAGWIESEARTRGVTLAPGAARALAERVGGFVTTGDAERRHQTRIAALELDKLALYRDSAPVTPDDVAALVAEAEPSSVWAFTDAVGERKRTEALEQLERLLPVTPEPVLLAVLHRRVRELIEMGDRLAAGERLATAARAMGINSEFRAKTLAAQARNWTVGELRAALDGILELDAMVKGAPGSGQDEAQRRLAFSLWVVEHGVGRDVQRRG